MILFLIFGDLMVQELRTLIIRILFPQQQLLLLVVNSGIITTAQRRIGIRQEIILNCRSSTFSTHCNRRDYCGCSKLNMSLRSLFQLIITHFKEDREFSSSSACKHESVRFIDLPRSPIDCTVSNLFRSKSPFSRYQWME